MDYGPYYHLLKYLLFLLKHPVYIYIYIYIYIYKFHSSTDEPLETGKWHFA